MMGRILIALWDGGGNSPPVLSLAGALVGRGHDVRVIADRSLSAAVERSGADHIEWDTAPQRSSAHPDTEFIRDYEARTPSGAVGRLRDRLIVGPARAFMEDTQSAIERFRPDVVLVENLLLGSQIAAEASGLPCISLVPNIYPGRVTGSPPFGLGMSPRDSAVGRVRDRVVAAVGDRMWNVRLDELNSLRRSAGLRPVATVFGALELPDRVLVMTSAAFEFTQGLGVPSNVIYCGPRLEDPDWAKAWEPPEGHLPLVLASLSTTTQNQHQTLPRVVDALGRLPVRGVVTTGPSAQPVSPGRDNVTVLSSAPHSALLRHAGATVSHGGHGTVIKSLAAGVPLVCIPVSRDQPDTAARVVAAGAGIRLRAGASARTIARAVDEVLTDSAYAEGAARMARAIAADREGDRAVEEIESLLGSEAGRL